MVDEKTVRHMANLAKLGLTEAEIPIFQQKFSDVMAVVSKVTTVNTDGITPMQHPLDAPAPLREDIVTEHNERSVLLQSAPNAESGFFKVPKVIE
jgi:aspartyl-tRNA(Asn)/glutamyl-tRNA(Gln) amidotransferase subunit C